MALPTGPTIGLLVLIGLDNEKDAMTSCWLDRKEVRLAIRRMHSGTGWPVWLHTGRIFLSFGRPSVTTELAIVYWIEYYLKKI